MLNKILNFFKKMVEWVMVNWSHPVKKWYLLAAGVILFALLVYGTTKEEESAILYAEVLEGNFKVSVTEPGEIRASNATTVLTPRPAQGWGAMTLTYLVPEGVTVKEGEIVAGFDQGEAKKRMDDAESQLKILMADLDKANANNQSAIMDAESNLKSQELAFELSKLSLERSKYDAEMERRSAFLKYQQDSISLARARQGLKSKLIVNQSDIAQLNLKISQARSSYELTKADLEKLQVKAPISGLVIYESNWNTGRKVNKGDQMWPNSPIMQLPDLSSLQTTTAINEVDVSKIKKGQKVSIKLDAFPQFNYDGSVIDVASVGKPKRSGSNAKVFEVVIDIAKSDSIMKPGMTVSNEIMIETIPIAKYVPIESVIEENGDAFVWLKSTFGLKKTKVKLGPKNDNYVVILDGVSKGDVIALNPMEKTADSMTKPTTAGL